MFSSPGTFEEVFPEIEDITIDIKEEGYMVKDRDKKTFHLTKKNIRPEFNCGNISCTKNGGINIQSLIQKMYKDRETHTEEFLLCKGYEKSRKCMNGFEIDISIIYKEISTN